ncbi:MAG: biotin--[Bacteroidaceae bacterium]|nr:biotin--[acetyl-CoA-carboxylase] ligase [Bacteroidaceae bacterium]
MKEEHFCLDDSPWFRMMEMDEVTSTNDFLRYYHPVGPERRLTLVTAEYQTAGRGAGTNRWESARGQNLLFSLLTHPRHIQAERMFVLSEALALAIREALESEELRVKSEKIATALAQEDRDFPLFTLQSSFSIKWPNDIYYGDGKVCGMLIENDLQGRRVENCVMGVGVNVNQTEFETPPNPASLAQILGHPLERRFVLERIVERFARYYNWTEQGRFEELHTMYLGHLYRRGEEYTYADEMGHFRGTIVDVEPTGHLIVRDAMGRDRRYAFKEVEYVMN